MASEIKDRLTEAVKTAMKSGDKSRVATLRLLTAALKQKEVDERIELDDPQVVTILDKAAKQRRESIEQFSKANRNDLVEKEETELVIIQEFLPAALSDTEIAEFIESAIQESLAESMRDMGKVMGILRPKLQGRADMSQVSADIKKRLS